MLTLPAQHCGGQSPSLQIPVFRPQQAHMRVRAWPWRRQVTWPSQNRRCRQYCLDVGEAPAMRGGDIGQASQLLALPPLCFALCHKSPFRQIKTLEHFRAGSSPDLDCTSLQPLPHRLAAFAIGPVPARRSAAQLQHINRRQTKSLRALAVVLPASEAHHHIHLIAHTSGKITRRI